MSRKYTPVKMSQESTTAFGVQKRTFTDGSEKYKFTDTPSGTPTWIIRDSITSRWGFDPEDGQIIDIDKVPEEFKKLWKSMKMDCIKRGEEIYMRPAPGDETIISEGLRESTVSTPTEEVEHSDFQEVEAEESKTPERREEMTSRTSYRENSPILEASDQSTPKVQQDVDPYEDDLEKRLSDVEEWRLWTRFWIAEFAGTERPANSTDQIRTGNLRMWEKMGCLDDTQTKILKFLLQTRRLGMDLNAFDKGRFESDYEMDGQDKSGQEQKLSTLRIYSEDMVDIHNRAVEFLEANLQILITCKRPPVDPSLVALLPSALRRYSHSVKEGYYELANLMNSERSTDPDMKRADSHLNKIYNNRRRQINRLVLRFLKVVAEVAIPHIKYTYENEVGLETAPPEDMELNSVLSEAVSLDSRFEPTQEQDSYSWDSYLGENSSEPKKDDSAKEGYLSSTRVRGASTIMLGTPAKTSNSNLGGQKQTSTLTLEELSKDPSVNKALSEMAAKESMRRNVRMNYLTTCLEKEERELEGIEENLESGKNVFGNELSRDVKEELKVIRKEINERIRDLKDDLKKLKNEEVLAGVSSETPTIVKSKSKDRRVTLPLDIEKNESPRGRVVKDRYIRDSDGNQDPNRSRFPVDLSLYDEEEHEAISGRRGEEYYDSDGRPRRKKRGHRRFRSNDDEEDREDQGNRNSRNSRERGYSDREDSSGRHQKGRGEQERDESTRQLQEGEGNSGRRNSHGNRGEGSGDPPRDRRQNEERPDRGGDGSKNRKEQPRDNRRRGREGDDPSSSPGSSDSDDDGGGGDRGRRGNDRRQGQGPGRNRDQRPNQGQAAQPDQLSPDERAAWREMLEGFDNEEEMRRFYKMLPVPWNVVPKPVGKKQQEIVKMIQMTVKSTDHFTGETETGTYLEWRILVINRIHSKPLSISDKIHLLGSVVKQSDDNLRQIFRTGVHTPKTYRRIIKSLEGHYGGKERTYTYLMYQMLSMSKFSLKDLRSLSIARGKVDRFIEHVGVHQVGGARLEENRTLMSLFMSSVLTEKQVRKYREETQEEGIEESEVYSLQTLADWLAWKEENLEWVKMHYNPMVMGVHKPKMKTYGTSSHRVLFSKGAEASKVTTCATQALNSPRSKTVDRPQKAKPSRVSLITSERDQETSEEEEKESSEESEEENEASSEDTSSEEEDEDESVGEDVAKSEAALAAQEVRLPLCSYCKTSRHKLHTCEDFLKLTVKERKKYVEKEKRCTNCLSPAHKPRKCNSSFKCKHCDGKHHSVLCFKTHGESPSDKTPG